MKYLHLVTFTYITENGGTCTSMYTLETKKIIPTVNEWNNFTTNIPALKMKGQNWAVLSLVTLQK